eukprot:gene9716-2870_t
MDARLEEAEALLKAVRADTVQPPPPQPPQLPPPPQPPQPPQQHPPAALAAVYRVLKMEPLEDIVRNYSNTPGHPGVGPSGRDISMEDVLGLGDIEPSLESLVDPNERDPRRCVFRSFVVHKCRDWVELAGSVTVPNRLMERKREGGHLKKWDIVTGRMVPNGDSSVGTKWFAIHVLRVDSRLRVGLERKTMVEAQMWRVVATEGDLDAGEQQEGDQNSVLAEQQSRAKANAEKQRQLLEERAAGRLTRRDPTSSFASLSEVLATPEQAAAGFVVQDTKEGGKIRFEGVVGIVEDSWAIISRAVFLHLENVSHKWGTVMPGDLIGGLMVVDACGGCECRCIHVHFVDRGGRKRAREEKEKDEREAEHQAMHERRAQELATQDHKSEVEKLKEAAQARREAEKRRLEEERQKRRLAREAEGRT